jgi:hypothetical protein
MAIDNGHQGQDQDQAPAPGRVRFGDGPTDTMPGTWAESMFRRWRSQDPEGFGFAMAQAATGVAPKPPTRRRAAAEQ